MDGLIYRLKLSTVLEITLAVEYNQQRDMKGIESGRFLDYCDRKKPPWNKVTVQVNYYVQTLW